MKILYIAKHNSGGNDDEGAITWALRANGHEVHLLQEGDGDRAPAIAEQQGIDLVLFHKWFDIGTLKQLRCKKVFWYFDLVEWPSDPTLARRSAARVAWMKEVMPHVDIGFCTDGDWAEKHPDKLVWLCQGADERICGRIVFDVPQQYDVLFTGIGSGGGVEREKFVALLQKTYGEKFHHVRSGVHRLQLKELIARSKVVVAPWSPVTDKYWSNRVYNALGFGACLVHPWCGRLARQYSDHVRWSYKSPEEMLIKIDECLTIKSRRDNIADAGLRRTLAEHTYRRRCELMIDVVESRLGWF